MFVGDSLNRGQWISMVCLLQSVIPADKRSMSPNAHLTIFRAEVRNQYWKHVYDVINVVLHNMCLFPSFNWISLYTLLAPRLGLMGSSSQVPLSWVSFPAHRYFCANFQDYNATVEFLWAPLLVESNSDDPVNHRLDERIIRPDTVLRHASLWENADILVFNTYLWWRQGPVKLLSVSIH